MWYLLLPAREEMLEPAGTNIVGIDLGVANLAVVSTTDGKAHRFLSGRAVQAKRNRFFNRRYSLSCAKKPHIIKRDQDKEHRWMKDVNHKISRTIIRGAQKVVNSAIALEEPHGIRERVKATKK